MEYRPRINLRSDGAAIKEALDKAKEAIDKFLKPDAVLVAQKPLTTKQARWLKAEWAKLKIAGA